MIGARLQGLAQWAARGPRLRVGWLAVLAGVLQTAAFAPVNAWLLQLLAMAVLALLWSQAAPRRAAWLGAAFSFGCLCSGLWWLYISMHDFGGLPPPVAAAAVALLAAGLSLYMAAAGALFAHLRRGRVVLDGLLLAACCLLAELARGQWFTGFPWMAPGYAHTSGPLALLAPWVGVYGLGAAAALLGAGVAAWASGRGRALLLLALLPGLGAALGPREFTSATGALRVSLLQPNVPQDLKFDPDRLVDNMAALQQQLQAATGTLVLTPESVLPVPQADLDPDYWAALIQPFQPGGRAALIGTFLGNDTDGYVNSMVGVPSAAGGPRYHYGKRHLLPFGEYMPPGFRWFVELMNIPLGDQASGQTEAAFEVAGQRVRPLICYEDLFGEDFVSSVVGPQAATVLANASNLAWFGRWMMQDQHLQFSQMRAMEFQRPLVRATNTGATAVIDPYGRITARLPAWTTGTLDAEVEGRVGDTPYASWLSAWGLKPAWALAVLVLAGVAVSRRARPRR